MTIIKRIKKHKILVFIVATLVVLLILNTVFFSKMIVVRIDTSYAFDVGDYRELSVFYKYIFVGYVDEHIGYEHDKDIPRSNYQVTPLLNIQGNLQLNEKLIYKKEGGLTKTRQYTLLLSGDVLPETGKLYIFCTRAIDNGDTLYSSSANGTIELEKGITKSNILDSQKVSKMILACENPKYLNSYGIRASTMKSKHDASDNSVFSIEELSDSKNLSEVLNKAANRTEVLNSLDDTKLKELAGNYNYSFVGKVTTNGKLLINEYNIPYIEYSVLPVYSIIDGTKRNYSDQQFVDGIELKFAKYGGLSVFGDDIEVDKNRADYFPEVGELCIFTCASMREGDMLYSYSPYSVVKLEADITEMNINDSKLVRRFESAKKKPSEVASPIMKENGTVYKSNYTLSGYSNYLYYQEIELAQKENREPDFKSERAVYDYIIPDWLE